MAQLQAEARDWFGLPQDCREALVERARVDGLCVGDSLWDLSEAEIVDPYAGYRVERYAPGRFILREGRRRYYFEAAGDTLLWTGYEDRLILSKGDGTPVLMPWGAERTAAGGCSMSGLYSQKVAVSEEGRIWSEATPATVVMNGDTISDAVCIRTARTIETDSAEAMRQESARLYVRGCAAPLAEVRRTVAGDSATAWDTQLMLLSALEGATPKQALRMAAARPGSKIGLTATQASGGNFRATFTKGDEGGDAELLLCSPSGIVYWSQALSGLGAGEHTVDVPADGYPGPLLLMVICGSESEKTLVRP